MTTTGQIASPRSADIWPHPTGTGPTGPAWAVGRLPEMVAIDGLVREGSPRSAGEDEAHVQRLVEADGPLPPILVHRATMRIIDGFHRVAAATRQGRTHIEAHLLDESLDAAFVTAVETNVTHGLPLSLADRRAAAGAILLTYPQWSDRAVAKSTGLSAKTVATIRCANGQHEQSTTRLGRDGRVRPLNTATGRHLAAELIKARPEASLREIAEAAGISPGTVRDVRIRLSRGEDPVAPRVKNPDAEGAEQANGAGDPDPQPADVSRLLATLSRDPAMRMNAENRQLLRWLHGHAVTSLEIGDTVPSHCVRHLVEFANRCAANWARLAQDLTDRGELQSVPGRPCGEAPIRKCG